MSYLRDAFTKSRDAWYEREEVSQEQVAHIAGLNRTNFLLALAREKVEAFHVDFDDLKHDLDCG